MILFWVMRSHEVTHESSMNLTTFRFRLFVCLFGVYGLTQEFFTHMETSSLPVNGCKFSTLLGTRGHWAVRDLQRATHTVSLFIMVISEDCDTHTYCRAFSSGAVTTCFFRTKVCRGWDSNTQPSACGPNALTHAPPPLNVVSFYNLCNTFADKCLKCLKRSYW